jgi:hypothetical protein
MYGRTPLAALIASAALVTVGLPTAANAASPAATQAKVGKHLQKAQAASKKVTRFTRSESTVDATAALKVSAQEIKLAADAAVKLAVGADESNTAGSAAVLSLTAVVGTEIDALNQLTTLIPTVEDPKLQLSLAAALKATTSVNAKLVSELTGLVQDLTGTTQALATKALTTIQTAVPALVEQIADVASLDDLSVKADIQVQSALSIATTSLQNGLTDLAALLPQVSVKAEVSIKAALAGLTSTVQGLLGNLQQITADVSTAATAGVTQAMNLVQGLLSNVLGALSPKDAPVPAPAPAAGDDGVSINANVSLDVLLKLPLGLPKGIISGITGLLGSLLR